MGSRGDRQVRGGGPNPRDARADFDPVREGEAYGLSPEMLRELAERARREAPAEARQRFHDLATKIAEREQPRVATPGKASLVEVEARGRARVGQAPQRLPGKATLVEHARHEVEGLLAGLGLPSRDEVAARKAAAERLVQRAASALAVAPAPVHMDDHARARTDAHRTNAVMADGSILLHPERFDPASGGALQQVAHELVHVVQLHVDSRVVDDRGDQAAEREASTIAAQVAAGKQPDRPRVRLTAREAADRGEESSSDYLGANECLTPATTGEMSDDQLQATSRGTLGTLGRGPDEGALANRELARFELARRGAQETPPEAPAQSFAVEGIIWGDDATYIRWQLEQLFANRYDRTAEQARYQLQRHLQQVRERAGYSPVAGVPESVAPEAQAEIELVTRVIEQVDRQLPAIQTELDAFIARFETNARQLGHQILDESEQRITHELERYGISSHQVTGWRMSQHDGLARSREMTVETVYTFDSGPEATEQRQRMMAAAREIAVSERQLQTLRERRTLVTQRLLMAESCDQYATTRDDDFDDQIDGGVRLRDLCGPTMPELRGTAPQLRDLLESLGRAIAHKQEEHQQLRADREGQFPVIATYTSGETVDLAGLDRLASAPSAATIGRDAAEKLANIRRVREALGGDLSIYELPQLLDLAKAREHVAPNSPRDRVVQQRIEAHGDESFWRSIGIMVLSIGLGLIAAIPTGGASLAVTGTVLAAEVAGLALDAYLLYQSVEEYEVRGALTNTDFDRARVLSHDEPSLFWLALDILGTAVGAAGALHSFREVARVRRAILAARNVDEAGQAMLELRRLHAAGDISANALQRLEREILRDLPDAEIARALGRVADDALRPAAEVATAMGRALDNVVGPGDIAHLSEELGIALVTRAELDVEVRVLFDIADNRVIRARTVEIGANATIGDVLAHRETVQLLRQLENTTESLGRSFDELVGTVVDASGRTNPFQPGSQAFNSWFELRKYPEMIQQRMARLGADGVSRSERELLREQVSFFETELAHHRRIVDSAVLERGDDFIARAARSNEAAFTAGYPREVTLPDGRRFPIGEAGSQYYYAVDGSTGSGRYILRRYVDAVDAPAITLSRGADGLWHAVEGGLSRSEAAVALVRSWPELDQTAFAQAVRTIEARHPGARVVPLAGIHRTDQRIGDLLLPPVRQQIQNALADSLARTYPRREATRIAREQVQALANHQIVVVRGTDQLRAFGYRRSFVSSTGEVIEGDLHHWVPLYLGGDHRIANLLDLDPATHNRIHDLLDNVPFGDVSLDPNQIGRLDVDFDRGVATLMPDGSIKLESISGYMVSRP